MNILWPWTDLVLACHLMGWERPEHLFEDLAEAGTQMATFHLESQPDSGPVIPASRGAWMTGPESGCDSRWNVTIWVPASARSSKRCSGRSTIRWQARTRSVQGRRISRPPVRS